MFDIASTELLLIVVVAVLVIGPKDLPRALYKLGQVVGKARGMARHFRTGIDAMVREAELEELQKQWAKQNEEIMQRSETLGVGGSLSPAAAPGEAVTLDETGSTPDLTIATDQTPPVQASPLPAQASPPPAHSANVADLSEEVAQQSLPLDTPDSTSGSRST